MTPTKEYPVFIAQNNYTGDCIGGLYQNWEIKNDQCWICGVTTAVTLTNAIKILHEYIRDNNEYMDENTKFDIYMLDGTCNKFGEPTMVKCYSISIKKAKQFRIF